MLKTREFQTESGVGEFSASFERAFRGCYHFSVTLALPKLLVLGNAKENHPFLLHCTRFLVTL
jgi:hypothetical protein